MWDENIVKLYLCERLDKVVDHFDGEGHEFLCVGHHDLLHDSEGQTNNFFRVFVTRRCGFQEKFRTPQFEKVNSFR